MAESIDATDWRAVPLERPDGLNFRFGLSHVVGANGIFVVATSNGMWRSTDGETWEAVTLAP